MKSKLDITPSPRLLAVLGDIPLQPWQCLAELVDNSLDELLKLPDRSHENPLVVEISIVDEGAQGIHLTVRDNGSGMGEDELERSVRAGHSGKNRYGSLGLFGMGFNIATARLGSVTTVTTTQLGFSEALSTTIDFADIQSRESFSVPLSRTAASPDESGTTVRVHLKREMAELLRRPAHQQTLRNQLGDVYSFLLRDHVPGLSRDGMSSRLPVVLTLNGERIEPKLPCVWSDTRSVLSYGQQVHAVQYIDTKLTAATACLDCGYWDRKNGPEHCEECGSRHLELRERRIWGWIGIQRFIDSTSYGIDFLRYGRKILKQDKGIFTYTDPDTLQSDAEYPIEMPANQGRIIGEIHLDHVPVTYQKNDFDRQSNDWQKAIEVIRGTQPLKPKGARQVNDSPLARLYSAYRRNDPGLRYLTPGDGKAALHTQARKWATYFDKNIARFMDDTEWFTAAERHQRIKDGVEDDAGDRSDDETASGGAKVPGAISNLIGGAQAGTTKAVQVPPPSTQADLLEEARTLGRRREDLCDTFRLGGELGDWEVIVIVTRANLKDSKGRPVPVSNGVARGNSIEVFVAGEHPLFKEFDRDVRDVALMHAASVIRMLGNTEQNVAEIFSELILAIPDLRVSPALIIERISHSFDRIRRLMLGVIASDPDPYWGMLSVEDKQYIEQAGALELPDTPMVQLVADGRFILYCPGAGLIRIIEDLSAVFFEGAVFRPSLRHRPAEATERIVRKITQAISTLSTFAQDELMRQKDDIRLAQLYLELLDDQLASEELLS